MAVEIEKKTFVTVTAEEFLAGINDYETCEVICAVAEKFNESFRSRQLMASTFAESLNEDACRFLAEVVTSHFMRTPRNK